MIDTHTHLNLSPLSEDVEGFLQRAREQNVTKVIVPGVTIETSLRAVELSKQFPEIKAGIGIHPEEADNGRTVADRKEALEKLLQTETVTAIGECGLDYSGDVDHDAQQKLLALHIELALKYDRPLLIHCRNSRRADEVVSYSAYADLLQILQATKSTPRFVLHCVSGSTDYVQSALKLGGYVSFAGNVTYPSAQAIRAILDITPKDRILTETDAPFLSPQSKRGTTNEPANVRETGEFMANYLEIPFADFDELTTANAQRFFQIA